VKQSNRFVTVMTVVGLALSGCALGVGAPAGVAKVYSGFEPQGDLVAVTVNGSEITVQNQTQLTQIGPIHFSRITDPSENNDFNNLYRTDALDSSGKFLRFALMNGVAVAYQAFDATNTAVGNPGHALYKEPLTVEDWKPADPAAAKLFTRIECMPPNPSRDGVCCFECERLTDTGEGTGFISGAKYDIRVAAQNGYVIDPVTGLPYGIENPHSISNPPTPALITWSDLGNKIDPITGTFQIIDMDGHLDTICASPDGTLLGAYSGNGGTCLIPQADTHDFKPVYGGTYLAFDFDLNPSNQSSMKVYTHTDPGDGSGNGNLFVSEWPAGSEQTMTISPFAHLSPTGGPGGVDLLGAFQTASCCASAPAQNAHLCAGSFLFTGINNAVFLTIDPRGNYLFYLTIDLTSSPTLHFAYGLGIKDSNYTPTK
jgi:hypothetical protein